MKKTKVLYYLGQRHDTWKYSFHLENSYNIVSILNWLELQHASESKHSNKVKFVSG